MEEGLGNPQSFVLSLFYLLKYSYFVSAFYRENCKKVALYWAFLNQISKQIIPSQKYPQPANSLQEFSYQSATFICIFAVSSHMEQLNDNICLNLPHHSCRPSPAEIKGRWGFKLQLYKPPRSKKMHYASCAAVVSPHVRIPPLA